MSLSLPVKSSLLKRIKAPLWISIQAMRDRYYKRSHSVAEIPYKPDTRKQPGRSAPDVFVPVRVEPCLSVCNRNLSGEIPDNNMTSCWSFSRFNWGRLLSFVFFSQCLKVRWLREDGGSLGDFLSHPDMVSISKAAGPPAAAVTLKIQIKDEVPPTPSGCNMHDGNLFMVDSLNTSMEGYRPTETSVT